MWSSFAVTAVAGGLVIAGTIVAEYWRRAVCSSAASSSRRVIVAVSGTIQDGFELRKNIDYLSDGECVKAVFIGYGVVRGVKMYLDVKDVGCREYDASVPHRVNPAMVLTGEWCDANQYALYLVDERACLNALLGEPRLLTMVPDAVRLQLDDVATSPEVSKIARAFITADGKANASECAVLAVVPCYHARSFVAAPPVETRPDGTCLTSFHGSLAAFAGLDVDATAPGTAAWNAAVASALATHRAAIADGGRPLANSSSVGVRAGDSATRDDGLYGTTPAMARLSRRLTVEQFNTATKAAGVGLIA